MYHLGNCVLLIVYIHGHIAFHLSFVPLDRYYFTLHLLKELWQLSCPVTLSYKRFTLACKVKENQ